MLDFKVKTNFGNINIDKAITKSLNQSVLLVQWKAVTNAPYITWNLRRSINTKVEPYTWIVWTNVKYAQIREYINKKNPSRKYYMQRALESSETEINNYFAKNITKALNE